MSGGGSGGGTQTVTQVQQIPDFEQQFSQENQDLSRALGTQQYPQYQGALNAPLTDYQNAAIASVPGAANSYQPYLNTADALTRSAASSYDPVGTAAGVGQSALSQYDPVGMASGAVSGAMQRDPTNTAAGYINASLNGINPLASDPTRINAADPNVVRAFMSPYVMQSLAPQIDALQTQIGQQHQQIAGQATAANAFGDSRQGVQDALTDHYGNMDLSGLVGQGFNTAFTNALQSIGQQQQAGLAEQGVQQAEQGIGMQAGSLLGNLGLGQQGLGINAGMQLGQLAQGQQGMGINLGEALAALQQGQQQFGLSAGSQEAQLGQLAQQLGLGGSTAVFNAGQQVQNQQQQELATAYQQFQNQAMWPYQQLNVRESALSNSPYNIANNLTVPAPNSTATNLGAFASLAGGLGTLVNGTGSRGGLFGAPAGR